MLDRLLNVLIQSPNDAADDALIDALRHGNPGEQANIVHALLRRQNVRGLSGMIGLYETFSDDIKLRILDNVPMLHTALRECGRSEDQERRLAAIKLIALSRQGKLAYVLSENLHAANELYSKAASEAMVALSKWICNETRRLQKGDSGDANDTARRYAELMEQRPEIEAAVARAMDVHRGRHNQDLSRAGLLLCDWAGSKTLAILHTAKHGGQTPMVRRLQQLPASEHIEAFLLGASHGQLRNHFGTVFSQIVEAPVLDALLRRTHWLADHQLQLCVHQVARGTWLQEPDLAHDISRRPPEDAAKVGEWIACTGIPSELQDERLNQLRLQCETNFSARLQLLRIAAKRKRGTSVNLLKQFITDPDERLARLAVREIIRRRPSDMESVLLKLIVTAPPSLKRVVSRAIGQVGFDHFWQRFDRVDKATRKQAGRAMLKLLPDAAVRLGRRMTSGTVDERVKAMQMAQELELCETLKTSILPLAAHINARVRSKAIALIGQLPTAEPDVVLDKVLHDVDPRVRSNAIEIIEGKRRQEYVPLLAERARSSHNRERANAVKALHRLKVSTAIESLTNMLHDPRSEHRISGLWAMRQIGWWQLIGEVAKLAKTDENLRVRRYALGVLKGVAELAQAQRAKAKAA